jgi:hemerythrin superfamily protein
MPTRYSTRDETSEIGDGWSGKTTSAVIAGAAGFGLGLLAAAGRKVAVQAPTYAAGDWVEGLKAEHKLARKMLEALEQTTDDDLAKRRALILQLQHALGKHAVQEEDIIYCALRAQGEVENADKLHHDHGYVKQYLYDLENLDKDDPKFLKKVKEFRKALVEHMVAEEEEIFPALRLKLSDEENKKLTNRMNREGFKVA